MTVTFQPRQHTSASQKVAVRIRQARRSWSSVTAPSGSLIVPSRRGAPRNANHMLRWFHEDLERIGLQARRQHDARRTFITVALSDGPAQGHAALGDARPVGRPAMAMVQNCTSSPATT
jgi:hypothetical protein